MQITRLTTPSFDAVSNDELEAWLRIDCGSDPETLALLVGSATEIVEGLTNCVLGRANYQIEFNDVYTSGYRIPLYPIKSIESVAQSGVWITGWQNRQGTIVLDDCPSVATTVTVIAGHDNVSSIPDGLRHAIAVLVSASYNSREEISDQTMKTVERLCAPHRRMGW